MRNVCAGIMTVALLTACSGDGGGPPTGGNPVGTISGQVIDVDSANAGVAGVSVQFTSGSATRTATTGSNGSFTLANVAAGSWQAQLQLPAAYRMPVNETGMRTANVTANQTANLTAFQLARPKGSVSGTVEEGGTAVAGGTVTAARGGFTERTATPNAAGYTIASLPVGSWTVTLTPPNTHQLATGETGTRTVSITENQTATVSAFQLEVAPPAPTVVEIHLTAGQQFSPQNRTIAPGTTVRWINDVGGVTHTITPEFTNQAGVWQEQTTNTAGVVFEHTFTVPSQTYRYRCVPHSSSFTAGMVGQITVTS